MQASKAQQFFVMTFIVFSTADCSRPPSSQPPPPYRPPSPSSSMRQAGPPLFQQGMSAIAPQVADPSLNRGDPSATITLIRNDFANYKATIEHHGSEIGRLTEAQKIQDQALEKQQKNQFGITMSLSNHDAFLRAVEKNNALQQNHLDRHNDKIAQLTTTQTIQGQTLEKHKHEQWACHRNNTRHEARFDTIRNDHRHHQDRLDALERTHAMQQSCIERHNREIEQLTKKQTIQGQVLDTLKKDTARIESLERQNKRFERYFFMTLVFVGAVTSVGLKLYLSDNKKTGSQQ